MTKNGVFVLFFLVQLGTEMPDSNFGLLNDGLLRCHWATTFHIEDVVAQKNVPILYGFLKKIKLVETLLYRTGYLYHRNNFHRLFGGALMVNFLVSRRQFFKGRATYQLIYMYEYDLQCCGSEIIFFGSGSNFSGNSGSDCGSDLIYSKGGKRKMLKQNCSTNFNLKKEILGAYPVKSFDLSVKLTVSSKCSADFLTF